MKAISSMKMEPMRTQLIWAFGFRAKYCPVCFQAKLEEASLLIFFEKNNVLSNLVRTAPFQEVTVGAVRPLHPLN